MSKSLLSKTFSLFLAAALACAVAPSFAQEAPEPLDTSPNGDMVEMPQRTWFEMIYKHGICRKVKNTNLESVFIPLVSTAEWSDPGESFLANIASMEGVEVTRCFPDGADMAFCYYTDLSGAYGNNLCGTNTASQTTNPVMRYNSGVFYYGYNLADIKNASGAAALESISRLPEVGASRCVRNEAGDPLQQNIFPLPGADVRAAIKQWYSEIYWAPDRKWCLAYGSKRITDQEMGASSTGVDSAVFIARIWNPDFN